MLNSITPKQYIILLVAALLFLTIPTASALEECTRIVIPSEIPCRVTTTYDPGVCSGVFVTIHNESGANISMLTLGNFGDSGFCQFNFTFKSRGDYLYNLTTGDTGLIHVKEDNMLALIFGLSVFIIYFGVMAFVSRSPLIKFFSGGMALVQVVLITAFIYANELGQDITSLLRMNFLIMLILGFGIAVLALFGLFMKTARLDTTDVDDPVKWGDNGKW